MKPEVLLGWEELVKPSVEITFDGASLCVPTLCGPSRFFPLSFVRQLDHTIVQSTPALSLIREGEEEIIRDGTKEWQVLMREDLCLRKTVEAILFPDCLIMAGLPGVGKTRVAEALYQIRGGTSYSTDKIRDELFSAEDNRDGGAAYTPQGKRRVYDVMAARAQADIEQEQKVTLDGMFLDPFLRGIITFELRRLGCEPAFALVTCDEGLVRQRLATPDPRSRGGSRADFAYYLRAKENLERGILSLPYEENMGIVITNRLQEEK